MSEPADHGGVDGLRAVVAGIVERALGHPRVVELLAVLEVYDRGGGGLVAGGLAYTALIAVLPGLLLALSIVGVMVSTPADQEAIVAAIARALPPLEDIARAAFREVSAGAVPTGLLAIVGLLWGSSRFYTALDQVFARIFSDGAPRNPIVRIVRGILVTGVLVVLPVVLITVAWIVEWVLALAPAGHEISGFATTAIGLISPLGSVILFTLGCALCYRFVPTAPPSWRAIALPAVLAGLILATFTQLFAFIAPRMVGVAALYGAFVAVFALLAWLSIGFNVLLLGASWSCVRAGGEPGGAEAEPSA
jgi:membrane protein